MCDNSRERAAASRHGWTTDVVHAAAPLERVVRPARLGDAPAVLEVERAAFDTAAESELVASLVADGSAAASLVAVEEGRIVGHALLSRIQIVDADGFEHPSLALAPVAVLPERQGEGIGGELIRASLDEARRLGAGSVVVLGHPGYYPRFGFEPALPRDILPPFDVPPEAWMVLELEPGALASVHGTVRYAEAFSRL